MSFSSTSIQFFRYEFPYHGSLNNSLDYTGCFGIIRDCKGKSPIHRVYSAIQSFLNVFFKVDIKTDYHHGMLIIRKPEENEGWEKDQLIIAHVTGPGIRTKRVNYLNYKGNDVTSLVVYVPTDERLRMLIAKYGVQTAFVPEKHLASTKDLKNNKKPGRISVFKISTHWMNKPYLQQVPSKSDQRIARAVADLLLGKQFLNKHGNANEAFYCMDYAITLLQSTILIRGLEEEGPLEQFIKDDQGRDLTRAQLSLKIHQKLVKDGEILNTLFLKNPIMQVNAYSAVSGFVAKQLDNSSVE